MALLSLLCLFERFIQRIRHDSPCCEEGLVGDAQWIKSYCVSSLLSPCCDKCHDQTNWMKTGFIFVSTSRSQGITEGSQGRT